MVVRVYGKCNGTEIVLAPALPGSDQIWTVTVPAAGNGVYVIELFAEDDCGDTGYFATVKMAWDPSMLRTKFEVLKVGARWSLEDVKHVFGNSIVSTVPVTY